MIKFLKNYFKMKVYEIRLKLIFYSHLNDISELISFLGTNKNEIISVGNKILNSFKNIPPEELQNLSLDELKKEYITIVANIVHEDKKGKDKNKEN